MIVSRHKIYFFLAVGCTVVFSTFAQETIPVNPGIDRWFIKTSLVKAIGVKFVSLEELLHLSNPIKKYSTRYDTCRIPIPVGKNRLKEGDLICTTGWIRLIALEEDPVKHRDGDYHIQITPTSSQGDSCLIVEVPYAKFVADSVVSKKCEAARAFLRANFLHGQEPLPEGDKLSEPIHVVIIGQLFFDAIHMNSAPRGKKHMHSYTCWEIHPVIEIKFAP